MHHVFHTANYMSHLSDQLDISLTNVFFLININVSIIYITPYVLAHELIHTVIPN